MPVSPSGCRYGPQRRTLTVRHPDDHDEQAAILHHVRPASIRGELNDAQKRAMGIDPDHIDSVVHTCVHYHSPAGEECPPDCVRPVRPVAAALPSGMY